MLLTVPSPSPYSRELPGSFPPGVKQLVYHPFNPPTGEGSGGSHRTAQLVELLTQSGLPLLLAPPYMYQQRPRLERLQTLRRAIFSALRSEDRANAQVWRGAAMRASYRHQLRDTQTGVVVWDDVCEQLLAEEAKALGIPVVAFPHNLESLVGEERFRWPGESPAKAFRRELRRLRLSDAVFCISRQEQWLLDCHGVPARYLPYFPPSELCELLRRVRERRRTSHKVIHLLLGTASYEPTRAGMLAQLRSLAECAAPLLQIHVAGIGTETLATEFAGLGWTFHGRISNESLEELLVCTTAALVHQQQAGGVSCRVVESALAGIPTIGNPVAFRDLPPGRGFYLYETMAEFSQLIQQADFEEPDPFSRPEREERELKACLHALYGR